MLFCCVLLVTLVLPKVTESYGPLNRDLAPTELRNKHEITTSTTSTSGPNLILTHPYPYKHNVDLAPTSTITTVATTTSSIVDTTSNGPHNVDLTPTTTSSYRPSAGMLYQEFAPTDKMLLTTQTSGPLN